MPRPIGRRHLIIVLAIVWIGSCRSDPPPISSATPTPSAAIEPEDAKGPGGYGFDRSDPTSGVANIMAAFATDEVTATCIYDAWGDVANVEPSELTPELMTFEICGTSILQMISGSGR